MIRRIVSFALHQPLFLLLLVILFIAGGGVAFKALPVEAFPDVSDIQVNVITLYPGRAPEEVEKQVTLPLEIALSGIPHSVRLFSHTQFGLSFIMLTFDDRTTDQLARQQVAERLRSVELPPGVQPDIAPLSTAIGEIYRYRLQGNRSPTELRALQDWVVERNLRLVPGVADIVSMGGWIKQYEVNPLPAKLKAHGISLEQLSTALGRGNANVGGGYLEHGAQQYLIRGLGVLRSADDIGNVVVGERHGTPVLVKEVAEVSVGGVPRQGLVGQDQDDDIVIGVVLMRKGENPSEVLEGVKEKVVALNESILPKEVQIVPYYDRTWLIQTTLKTVFKNLAEGAALVAGVLFLFLGNGRAAGIVALVIPLSLLAAFIGLTWRGIPANLLSLGALDFGIIVDGAVIVVENIFRRLSERREPGFNPDRHRNAILEATVEVGRPTFFSMLIIIVAHLPIFALQRHEGRIFAPMAYTVVFALIGALLFSLTLVPLLCFFFMRQNLPHDENGVVRFLKKIYHPILEAALNRRQAVIAAALVALGVSLALVPRLGTEFLPELNEGTIWINAALPPGLSLSEASKQCSRIRETLRTFPEVRSVISKAGRPEDGTDPKTLNMAEFFVDLKPPNEWQRTLTKEELIGQMDRTLGAIPGIETSFSQPIRDNILESISQIDGQIVVKIFGDDTDVLHAQAEELMGSIRKVPGVVRAFIDRAGESPQFQIEIEREQAARYGLNVSDIQDAIETTLGGKVVTEIWEGEKRFDVVVRMREADRTMEEIKKVLIDAPSGARIPLDQVTSFSGQSGRMNISRESGTRVVAVGAFIRGRDMGSAVKDMQANVQRELDLPAGYYVTWSGEFENQQRAMKRLAIIVPVSVFLIFVLLFDAFKSFKSALLILLNVPFALIGGIVALLLTGIPLSVSAAIGFIALFGQAVLNGVVMVSCITQLRDQGETVYNAVFQGAMVRFRTVMMTALLAALGLLPMALSRGIGAETQRPLAVVVIGGLVSATLLTLIVLPTLYWAVEKPTLPREVTTGRSWDAATDLT